MLHPTDDSVSYKGYIITVRAVPKLGRTTSTWSANYRLSVDDGVVHEFAQAACEQKTQFAAKSKALRFAKIEVDMRVEGGNRASFSLPESRPKSRKISWLEKELAASTLPVIR